MAWALELILGLRGGGGVWRERRAQGLGLRVRGASVTHVHVPRIALSRCQQVCLMMSSA